MKNSLKKCIKIEGREFFRIYKITFFKNYPIDYAMSEYFEKTIECIFMFQLNFLKFLGKLI